MSTDIQDVVDNLKFSEIKPSNIHGYGLFATELIAINTLLGTLDGQEIPESLHHKYDLTLEWNAIAEGVLLVRPYRTKYSYINHQRSPNLVIVSSPLRIKALRTINAGEELTLDYRKESLSKAYIESKGYLYL